MNLKVCLLLFLVGLAQSAKILLVYPLPGTSHLILGRAIARTLVEAGHDLTFVGAFKDKDPPKGGKYTEVILEGLLEEAKKNPNMPNLFAREKINPFINIPIMNGMGNMLAEKVLNHSAVQELLKSDQKFDLVIFEHFHNEALRGFAWHFKAPLIVSSSIGANSWVNPIIGNPTPTSYIPDVFLSYSQHMSFKERLINSLMFLANQLNKHFIFYPAQNRILQKYFPGAPHLSELLYNTSLIFLNSHISTSPAKPHVPALIEIGGYHVNPPKKLPQDLQNFLDSAKHGVIYFSMGSNLKSTDMPRETLTSILKSFSKLKQKVLWKFEEDNLPNLPSNVKIMKWCPQQDILAHHNIKAFITHGGLLSFTETIYHGVPVLCIPIFGDQKLNAAQYVFNGLGVSLPYQELTEETLTSKLEELLNNPKYSQNAKKRSQIFHDRQIKPKDNLVYWTEYVIRHQGAQHLRVAALDLAWYQYLLFDVVIFLGFATFAILSVMILSIKWICCRRTKKLKTQ